MEQNQPMTLEEFVASLQKLAKDMANAEASSGPVNIECDNNVIPHLPPSGETPNDTDT